MTVNKGFARRDRIAEQVRRELAELIRAEVKDPRIGMISITGVEVSADYAHARVFFSSMSGREHVDSALAGLQRAAGFLRRELGRRITLHNTPQLRFIFDESLERGADLSRLIHEAVSISDASDSTKDV
ncbi:MAG: 30S ribosome-binding factor RbfA [Candidatus Accumulibacter sp.]|nr:30S ribosome-binding factor RbfA [Accumulibacter sp.]